MSKIQSKFTYPTRIKKITTRSEKKNQSADNNTKISHMLDLSNKHHKAAIIPIFPQSITCPLETKKKIANLINKIKVIKLEIIELKNAIMEKIFKNHWRGQ